MPTDTLTSIDNLEQEVTELQAQLRDSIPALALLNEIPGQFAQLAAECTALNAASTAATAEARLQAEQLAAGHASLEKQVTQWLEANKARESVRDTEMATKSAAMEKSFAEWLQEAGVREDAMREQIAEESASLEKRFTQWRQEASAAEAQLLDQWNTFRSAAEAEQNQVMRIAMTTRQELTDRIVAQEKLVASLDERLARMNDSLANMVGDLRDARREQRRLALLLAIMALAALATGAAASWAVFFPA